MSDGQTKRGPSGRAIGIDGIEPHLRSECPLPYASGCPYCYERPHEPDKWCPKCDVEVAELRIARLHAERERLAVELAAVEDGTLPWIEARGSVIPSDLACEFSLSNQAANNRLNRLARVGLLRRWRIPVAGGGKAFAYAARRAQHSTTNASRSTDA